MTISYIEQEKQDQLCGVAYAETLSLLVREKVITPEKRDELFQKFAPITIRGGSFMESVRKFLGLEKGTIKVRFIDIQT